MKMCKSKVMRNENCDMGQKKVGGDGTSRELGVRYIGNTIIIQRKCQLSL